jgi:hypothetical protein
MTRRANEIVGNICEWVIREQRLNPNTTLRLGRKVLCNKLSLAEAGVKEGDTLGAMMESGHKVHRCNVNTPEDKRRERRWEKMAKKEKKQKGTEGPDGRSAHYHRVMEHNGHKPEAYEAQKVFGHKKKGGCGSPME